MESMASAALADVLEDELPLQAASAITPVTAAIINTFFIIYLDFGIKKWW
jgi:hypothetical protein